MSNQQAKLKPVNGWFVDVFGPGFIALFWGGLGLWAFGMQTMVRMSN